MYRQSRLAAPRGEGCCWAEATAVTATIAMQVAQAMEPNPLARVPIAKTRRRSAGVDMARRCLAIPSSHCDIAMTIHYGRPKRMQRCVGEIADIAHRSQDRPKLQIARRDFEHTRAARRLRHVAAGRHRSLATFDLWRLRESDVPLLSRRGVTANLATTPLRKSKPDNLLSGGLVDLGDRVGLLHARHGLSSAHEHGRVRGLDGASRGYG
jgi:hypothetical protein